MPNGMDFLRWLRQEPPALKVRALRHNNPAIVTYYWDGGAKNGHSVKDISSTGAFIRAAERWYVGTVLTVTFQQEFEGAPEGRSITILCKVVRHAPEGFGVSFMFAGNKDRKLLDRFIQRAVVRRQARVKFVKRLTHERGQAMIFTVLCMTIMLGFMSLAVDVGLLFRAKRMIQTAADSGAIAGATELNYGNVTAAARAANVSG